MGNAHASKKHVYLLGLALLVAISVGVSMSLVTTSFGSQSTPIHITEFAYPLLPSLEQAAGSADLVVEGVVKTSGVARWNTVNRQRPDLSVKAILQEPSMRIVTEYTVSVERVLKGTVADSRITFVQPGGRVGEDEVVVNDWRHLSAGEHVVLFLEVRQPSDRTSGFPNEWAILDKYVVTPDGRVIGGGDSVSVDDLYLFVAYQEPLR